MNSMKHHEDSDIGPIDAQDTWGCTSRSTALDGIIACACLILAAMFVFGIGR